MITTTEETEIVPIASNDTKLYQSSKVTFSEDQIGSLRRDIISIAGRFSERRIHNNQLYLKYGLDLKKYDPHHLWRGGSEAGKIASIDWGVGHDIALSQKEVECMRDANAEAEQSGYDLEAFSKFLEQKMKVYLWTPGGAYNPKGNPKPFPYSYTGNNYSLCKFPQTLLITVGCNSDGSVAALWAATVELIANPDGKNGDWKFNNSKNDNAFSTLELTHEIIYRSTYQQIIGEVEENYGGKHKDGDLLKNPLIIPARKKNDKWIIDQK